MTIYELSIITTTGFPYYNKQIKPTPEKVKVLLRFFDFSQKMDNEILDEQLDLNLKFDLTAGLMSALYEFAKNIDKKINVLEFKSKLKEQEKYIIKEDPIYEGDVLITVQTESFLRHKAIKLKMNLIYEQILTTKVPLDSAYKILQNEEDLMIDILTDAKARTHLSNLQSEIELLGNKFISEMKDYGLEAICITSFDLSPILILGKKYTLIDVEAMLRNIGVIPEIDSSDWIYRQSYITEEHVWVYIINSGVGPTVEESLFEPYFYLIIAKPNTYIAEFPLKLAQEFNKILG